MVKVSDYIFTWLADRGVRHVFLLTGGGAMHLNESIRRESRLTFICNHHEQACAMAAEGYARVSGKPGVINVTTGPGGINALNGVFGAWTDSIPMIVISGQVKKETCVCCSNVKELRQLGDQEADIISMAKGITKYAAFVDDPSSIRMHLEKAWHLATSGRPGPCWLDIPMDVQAALVEEASLAGCDEFDEISIDNPGLKEQCREIVSRLQNSPRPVLMVGTGVRLAGAVEIFDRVIRKLGIPVTTAWTAHDLMDSNDPLYCGRPGTIGDRAGNFAVQNAETLLVVGCRLNIRQVSYNWKSFARAAYKIQVDADISELKKDTVRPDLALLCDAAVFFQELERALDERGYDASRHAEWLKWCRERIERYPVLLPRHRGEDRILNPYEFIDGLFKRLNGDDVIVCGNGSACVIPFQVAKLRKGQRMFANSGCASMGYDLPAAIGAAVARGGKRVVCLAGDGSIQLNLQELQTVFHYRLPVKIFVLNNGGYLSIRSTQLAFFEGFIGESPASGVTFPDMVKVASAYGIPALRVERSSMNAGVEEALRSEGPFLCDVLLDPHQQFEPKLSSKQLPDGRIVSAPLEDLYPFLDKEELLENLLIPPMES